MTERVERTGGTTSTGVSSGTKPRALIHRKILDIAGANPNASMEAIADEVSAASITFVERVLEEYGDPADERPDEQHESEHSDTDTGDGAGETGDHEPETTASPQPGDSGAGGNATDGRHRETASDGGRQNPTVDNGPAVNAPESATGNGSATADDGVTVDTASDADESAQRGVLDDDSTAAVDGSVDSDPTDGVAGDTAPAGDSGDAAPEESDDAGVPDPSDLSDKQRETLVAVAERPSATQAEIAEELGVSRATVSKRLGSVDGFEWPERAAFVDDLFEYRGGSATESTVAEGSSTGDPGRVAALEARIEALETALEGGDETFEPDPELVHKVVHACMDAEYISQEEELEILRDIFQHGTGWP